MQALEFIGELSCDSGSTYRPYKIMYPVNASKWPEKGKISVHVFLSPPLTLGLNL